MAIKASHKQYKYTVSNSRFGRHHITNSVMTKQPFKKAKGYSLTLIILVVLVFNLVQGRRCIHPTCKDFTKTPRIKVPDGAPTFTYIDDPCQQKVRHQQLPLSPTLQNNNCAEIYQMAKIRPLATKNQLKFHFSHEDQIVKKSNRHFICTSWYCYEQQKNGQKIYYSCTIWVGCDPIPRTTPSPRPQHLQKPPLLTKYKSSALL